MRRMFMVLWMLSWSVPSAMAQVSVGIGLPGVSIGINLPLFPELVPVPGYPVYYAPRVSANYFFYDGMYWAYQEDNWYASSWYNGPWGLVAPDVVPLYVLRVPVRYYRQPPQYFRGWQSDEPPRWGEHWGHEWEQHRSGWDRWNRSSEPARAPLPVYQRQYSGDRYPPSGAAAGASRPEVPLPAARPRGAGALAGTGAGSAKSAHACSAGTARTPAGEESRPAACPTCQSATAVPAQAPAPPLTAAPKGR